MKTNGHYQRAGGWLLCLTLRALASMPAEVSLFFLRLIHSNLGMPLKASAGMLVMLLPGCYKSLSQLTVRQKILTNILLTVYTVHICQFGAPFLLLVTMEHKGQNFITWFVTNQDF